MAELTICKRCSRRVAHPDTRLCPKCDDDWEDKKENIKQEQDRYGIDRLS